jgi:tetratricopeptide (TPR) repeat protein
MSWKRPTKNPNHSVAADARRLQFAFRSTLRALRIPRSAFRAPLWIAVLLLNITTLAVANALAGEPPKAEVQTPFGSATAQDIQPAFEAANKLYEEGKFSDATAAYESLLQTGLASPALYFNLGNARFKAGHVGPALAAYHRAAALDPRDPDIRANLQFARNQVQGPTYKPAFYERWLSQLSLNEWSLAAAATFWAFFLLLAVRQIRPALRPYSNKWTLGLLLAALATSAGLSARLWSERRAPIATIIASEAIVRHGPLAESQTAFTLHDGAEVKILDLKDEWVQVTTDPRRIGWLTRDNLTR